MWTGVTGLLAHGEKMNVVGNNIANVSTVGFKGQRMDFADYVYQNAFTSNGVSQIGRGVKIGAIMGNFAQGPFESSTEATDLAISGRGFFQVQKIGSDLTYYTRAGNFRFNAEGYLVDPNGLALQGWKVDNSGGVMQAAGGISVDLIGDAKQSDIIGSGVPTDIRLNTWVVFPQQTTNIQFKSILPKDGTDNFPNNTNPFTGLFSAWDGTQPPATSSTPPIPDTANNYSSTIEVYDEAGTKHKVTIYYDKVNGNDYAGGEAGDIWEYIVTMDPAEDQRVFWDTASNSLRNVNETKAGGLLMSGTITFNSAGNMINQSSYTWGGDVSPETYPTSFNPVADPADPLNTLQIINLNPEDMANWKPAAISTNGLPLTVANFTGILDAQTPGSPRGSRYNIEIDFGIKAGNSSMPWENQSSLGSISVEPYVFNSSYRANQPKTGTEYLLLNTDYDPGAAGDLFSNPAKLRYQIAGVNYSVTPPTISNLATYQQALIDLTGATTGLTVSNGTIIDGYAGGSLILDTPANEANVIDSGTGTLKQAMTVTDTVNFDPVTSTPLTGTFTGPTAPYYAVRFADGTTGRWVPTPTDLTNMETTWGTISQIEDTVNTKGISGPYVDLTVLTAAVPANANMVAEFNKPIGIDADTMSNLAGAFTTNQAQNGYGYGDLSSWSVDQEGVLHGVYSNGVTLPLWQITLYDFNCTQGLRREGNNLFSQTRYSGEARSGPAGVAGLGSVQGYTLEQSNVDMATEFVQMITTQRGFQANSKIITTTDVMLDTVINMKR
jgi:flagellar hook protein FlgE